MKISLFFCEVARGTITPRFTFCSGLTRPTGFDLASAEVRDRTNAVKVRAVLLSY